MDPRKQLCKITKQHSLLLDISVPNSAQGNKSKAIAVLTQCLQNLKAGMSWWIKRDQTGFWHKMNKIHPDDHSGTHLWLIARLTAWGRFCLVGNLLCLSLDDLQEGLYWDHLVEGLTEEQWQDSQSFSTIPTIFLPALLWEILSSVLLSLLHLLYFILNWWFCLTVFSLIPTHKTLRVFILPFRSRKSQLLINSLLMFL